MNTELKRTIVDYIFDNQDVFGLHNVTTDKFKAYIYNDEGNYLIGGEKVTEFIGQAVKLAQQ